MGIYDRDWYKDAKKKDEAKESWYDPKQFRNGANGCGNAPPPYSRPDTGATLTSLSQEMAHKSGISSCVARTFNTANGSVQGCVAKAPKIQIGNFVLRDFEVAVMPNLPTMNILRMFRLEQQSGVMRISSR